MRCGHWPAPTCAGWAALAAAVQLICSGAVEAVAIGFRFTAVRTPQLPRSANDEPEHTADQLADVARRGTIPRARVSWIFAGAGDRCCCRC
jgi:hypothetical protein